MGILIRTLVAVALIATSASAEASYLPKDPQEAWIKEAKQNLCRSTDEYIKTLKFLREVKGFSFQEQASRTIAHQVSRGCDGAAERFSQILILIKTVGFSEKKSLEMALEFAATTPDVQKNFLEIFTKSFLQEFFDYEFSRAMKVALELSKGYKGDPAKAREDFIALSRFCRDGKKLGLPVNFCADYSVRVAQLSQHFDTGVSQPFFDFYKTLREKKEYGLDMKFALELSYGVLKSGPTAPENFTRAFDFAISDLKFDKKKALEFALDLSGHSYVGEEPPILQFTSKAQPES